MGPFSNTNIEFNVNDNFQKVRIIITNVLGVVVYDTEFLGNQSIITHRVDVNRFSTGSYFVTIKLGETTFLKSRFVKQ